MANRSVKVTLSANVADFKAQMRQASTSLDELVKKADKTGEVAQTGLGRMTQSMQQQRAQWDQAGAALTGFGVATTGALTASAKAAIDWESAFAGVKKTAGEGWNLDKLNADLRALASELPSSHAEIAAVAEAAGQLGIREENITSFTRAMINMGEATNMSADEAATTLARFANIMGTSQSEFENLGSAIVELGNNYATTEGEIAALAMRLASAGNQIGLTEGDVLGIATALSSVGIEADAGGTAFSRVMLDMRKAVDTGSEKLETFAQVAGMSSQAFAQLFQENAGEALTRFIQGLGEMEAAGKSTQPVLEALGMTDIRVGNALRSSAAAADLFTEAMATGNAAYQEGTALSKEAAARYETLASQMGILRNKVVEAAIGFGEQLMPAIKLAVDVIGGVVDTIGALPGPVQAVLAGFTGLAGTVALAGGAFALLAPRALEAVAAFKALATTFPAVAAGASTLAGAVAKIALPAAAFAGFTALIDSASKIDPAPVEELAGALTQIASTGATTSDALSSIFNSKYTLAPFRDEVKTTGDVLDQFEKTLNNAWGSSAWEKMDRVLGDWNAGDRAREQIAALDTTLAQMVASGNAEEAARLYEQLMHTASEMDLEIPADELEGQFGQYKAALAGAESQAEATGAASEVAADGIESIGTTAEEAVSAVQSLLDAMGEFAKTNMSADEAAINYAQTLYPEPASPQSHANQPQPNQSTTTASSRSGQSHQQS